MINFDLINMPLKRFTFTGLQMWDIIFIHPYKITSNKQFIILILLLSRSSISQKIKISH